MPVERQAVPARSNSEGRDERRIQIIQDAIRQQQRRESDSGEVQRQERQMQRPVDMPRQREMPQAAPQPMRAPMPQAAPAPAREAPPGDKRGERRREREER